MSDLLKSKSAEALVLLTQATKEEKELEALNSQLAQLSQKVADLTQSSREKRVYAESIQAATKALGGHAEVVEITSAKKSGKAKAAAVVAPVAAAAAPVAAKEAKGKKSKGGKTAKPAEKTAAPAKPAAAPKKTKTAAQATRVAGDDKRPPLHERLRIVLAEDQVTIPQAIERLRARDASWVPDSTDLNAYISLALSTHKETFERVSRGVYQVRKSAVAAAVKPLKKAVTAQKTNGTHNPSNGAGIEDLGDNVKDNPFAATAAA